MTTRFCVGHNIRGKARAAQGPRARRPQNCATSGDSVRAHYRAAAAGRLRGQGQTSDATSERRRPSAICTKRALSWKAGASNITSVVRTVRLATESRASMPGAGRTGLMGAARPQTPRQSRRTSTVFASRSYQERILAPRRSIPSIRIESASTLKGTGRQLRPFGGEAVEVRRVNILRPKSPNRHNPRRRPGCDFR